MNKTFRTIIEVAFSVFIGLLILFTVTSLLELIWSEPEYYNDAAGVDAPKNYSALYRSLAAITLATIFMFSSLRMKEKLRVLENGLLFGGVFTTFYGIISITAYNSPSEVLNFMVTLFALLVATAVGWLKFVRLAATAREKPTPELTEVDERLSAVEGTLSRMQHVFLPRDE